MLPVLMLLALVATGQGAQITVYRIHLNADGSALFEGQGVVVRQKADKEKLTGLLKKICRK